VPQPKQRFSTPQPEYKGTPNAIWLTTHIVYLPINTAMAFEDVKTVGMLCVDVCTRYNLYIKEEL
jgi:dTDP-4-amino-4,6-dideoxygalactose transaminase